jgi:hypothetical protein
MAVVAPRSVEDGNLDALFEQMRDPEGVRMAAFTPEDPDDRNAFDAHTEAVCDALQGRSGLDALTETLTTIRAMSPPTRAATPQPLASAHRPGRPATSRLLGSIAALLRGYGIAGRSGARAPTRRHLEGPSCLHGGRWTYMGRPGAPPADQS